LKPGDQLCVFNAGRAASASVVECRSTGEACLVFNLRVGAPHTFIADGFVVHNKGGGGGFGGGFHSGGGFGGGSGDNDVFLIIFGVVVGLFILNFIFEKVKERVENLDFSYSRSAIANKADKTRKLLEFIAKNDPKFAPDLLEGTARSTFVLLQKCWQARDYDPMKPLLMPDLYAEHRGQIQGMIHNHEINCIEGLSVQKVDLVNVRYPNDENAREFTALISASARDYYIDDRTRDFVRGDEEPAPFQEFWTFHLVDGKWLLREIEQTKESDALKTDNFFEPFTDHGVQVVYAETAGREGPVGPAVAAGTELKVTRVERLLNYLVQSDKLWDPQAMSERARKVFLEVCLAREEGDPERIPAADLFPEVAAHLTEELRSRQAEGASVEFRNLCVRKVELVLVRNYSDNTQDEFTARITAHAQQIVRRNGQVASEQPYVTPFEQYWTFGRLDGQWKLKEVEPPAKGREMVGQENVDEGVSAAQLAWYYQHPRAT
jgi:predicted lipid-binding transport protein (Tim44 family)